MTCASGRRTTPTATRTSTAGSVAGPVLGEIAGQTPPDIKAPGLGDALAGLRLGRSFRGLGKGDAHTTCGSCRLAVADFVAEAFETDASRLPLRGAASSTARSGRGRREPQRFCSATPRGTTAGRRARQSSPRAVRSGVGGTRLGGFAPRAVRSGRKRRSRRSPRATGASPAWRSLPVKRSRRAPSCPASTRSGR